MSTTTAATEQIPGSRAEPDPARVARSDPRDHIDGVPVYGWGQAPPYLRTQTQLGEARLKLADGQVPLAYIRTRKYGDVALYDPSGADKMKPLSSSTKARMAKRRTCPTCQQVRDEIVPGERCSVCRQRVERERLRLLARTCGGCGTVRERPYPEAHRRCAPCRRAQLAEKRERVAAWLEEVTTCAGTDCTVKVGAKTKARAWLKEQPWLLRPESPRIPDSSWRPDGWSRRCPPCTALEEQRQAEQRARWEREEQERREAGRRAAEERKAWAAGALVDPDVVVLDTETTGLHSGARIVEIAVLSSGGEVLLDTLLDPGEPIPRDASAIHGITDADVAGAPRFTDVLVQLTGVLDGKRVLIYNDVYDVGRLRHELTLHYLDRAARDSAVTAVSTGDLPVDLQDGALAEARKQAAAWLDGMRFEDVMIPYSRWYGDWSDYHGDYRWQPLGGGHRAAGDCRAVLDCLRAMGRSSSDETDAIDMLVTGNGGWGERMAG
ncbi:3'-5' exonuclease [Streptomyces mobaraensis]|uniref:3'-5' exonuclease n=1 Tax=Streptomyces mobaraensis TaxID=35621 RepID=A0A5N5VXG9_STRMB|nr:3'-5' exonuclease [Streptomyces mobaraensis]KAB7833563.1 3'-5' exonuclease [Streptomyces mobaraensis]